MNLLATRRGRRLLFALLYLSEGAPIGFIWWALPAHLRTQGLPVATITTITAALALPWALKFLWAPLVDIVRSSSWSRRSWIVAAQIAMGLFLLPIAFIDPRRQAAALLGLLLAHAIAAATQDVAIDALCIASVPTEERGSVNGWMQAGMLLGRAAFGGGALYLIARIGPALVIAILVATVWALALLVMACREVQVGAPQAEDRRTFGETLRRALREPSTWIGLALAATSGAAFEAVGALVGPYLVDRGFLASQVGLLVGGPFVGAMIAGALLGGALSDRLGRRLAVGLFLVLIAGLVALLAVLDAGRVAADARVVVLVAIYLAIGLFTAASYALFMDLSDTRIGATQFSAFMGATNACESWSSFAAGRLVAGHGYPPAFGVMAAVSLASLPLVVAARRGRARRVSSSRSWGARA